jgi:hypothetical protein
VARPRRGTERLREFALIGARARLQELQREMAGLRDVFPELFRGRRPGARSTKADAGAAGPRRGRRHMSAAERKAVSERMRRYWAERRRKARK